MNLEYLTGGAIAGLLLIYLVAALLWPEPTPALRIITLRSIRSA